MSELAVITIVRGRRRHLDLQRQALARSDDPDFDWVVVAMDDPGLDLPRGRPRPEMVHVGSGKGGLPLARARNAGARRALASGTRTLVFLDVDCLPDRALVGAYREATSRPPTRGTLACGPVAYLPPPPGSGYDLDDLDRLARPHPARPAPAPGTIVLGGDHDLFWSLSFALGAATWRTLGGFHEGYEGYGAEDTDFGAKARALGVGLSWVGSARAHHQHHPTQDPPRQHVDEILLNSQRFHARWGSWPMTGWLDAFVDEGLLVRTRDGYARATRRTDPLTLSR